MNATAEKPRIGFLGTGIMGSRMVRRLLAAGYFVTVFNRTPEKAAALADEGARVARDPRDAAQAADVLIAMFRWPQADEAWKTMTRQRIDSAAQGFRAIITDRKAAIDQADNETGREDNLVDYAIACNQYAWLVSNTVGDYEDALRLSQDAVRLSGQLVELKSFHAGFLDTLGRCYYACDDLPNAILHQSQAVALAPDSGQIRRQLEFFRQEAQRRGIPVPKPPATVVPPPGPASSATSPPAP